MTLRVLITAGGTSEKIDDIRIITNISTGRLGASICDAFSCEDLYHDKDPQYEITLIKSFMGVDPQSKKINIRNFFSSNDLENLTKEELTRKNYDAVLMAAAVSDYIPDYTTGKLDSSEEMLTIKMKKRKKILPLLRTWAKNETVIVGFKLLSGASDESLIEAANKQMLDHNIDMVIANDAKNIGETFHPVIICKANGDNMKVCDIRKHVALKIAEETMSLVKQRATKLSNFGN